MVQSNVKTTSKEQHDDAVAHYEKALADGKRLAFMRREKILDIRRRNSSNGYEENNNNNTSKNNNMKDFEDDDEHRLVNRSRLAAFDRPRTIYKNQS